MENIYHFLKKYLSLEFEINDSNFIFIFLISALLSALLLNYAVSNIIMILLVIYTIYNTAKKKIKPHFHSYSYWFFALYFLMLISFFWSIDKTKTLVGLQGNLNYFLIPFVFAFFPKFKQSEIGIIIRVFSISMVLYSLYFLVLGLLHFINTGSLEQMSHHALVSPLDLNRVLVSLLMVTALFYWIFNPEKTFLKLFSIVLLSVFTLLLSSKTVIVSTMLILFIIFLLKLKNNNISTLKYFLLLSIFPLVIFSSVLINKKFISEMIPRVNEIMYAQKFGHNYYFNGAELRLLYTRFLVELNKEEPIFFTGYGLDAAQSKINEKAIQYEMHPSYGLNYHFHNQFIQNMAELGIFGVLLLLFILYRSVRSALNYKSYFMLSFLIVFIMYSISDTPLSLQQGIYLFLFLNYLFLFQKEKKELINEF